MRKFSEYNKFKLLGLWVACCIVTGSFVGVIYHLTGVDLFLVYSGMPGYLCLGLGIAITQLLIQKYDKWLKI